MAGSSWCGFGFESAVFVVDFRSDRPTMHAISRADLETDEPIAFCGRRATPTFIASLLRLDHALLFCRSMWRV